MQIADANYLLRYILNDVEEQANAAKAVLDSSTVLIPIEVLIETVYVLAGVYQVPRAEITGQIKELIYDIDPNIVDFESVLLGLDYYAETKLDFVDCMLAAYSSIKDATILTFDKKLQKFIENDAKHRSHRKNI